MNAPTPNDPTESTIEHAIQVLGQFISFARGDDVPPQLLLDEAERAIEQLRALSGSDRLCG